MTHEESHDAPQLDATDDAGENQPRRAYTPPRLIVYGDARDLTQKVGSKGKLDGSGIRKTGF
jgi:hypothetical protein